MRVVSGSLRGMKLNTIEGDSTRPTREVVKEALFSIIMNYVEDSVFLDLFAGSGEIGIEAISTKVIKDNIKKGRIEEVSRVYNTDYKMALKKLQGEKMDIIFVDPPYNKQMGVDAIERISEYDLLSEEGIIIIETDTNEEVPELIGRYEKYNYKRYGRNILSMYRRKG